MVRRSRRQLPAARLAGTGSVSELRGRLVSDFHHDHYHRGADVDQLGPRRPGPRSTTSQHEGRRVDAALLIGQGGRFHVVTDVGNLRATTVYYTEVATGHRRRGRPGARSSVVWSCDCRSRPDQPPGVIVVVINARFERQVSSPRQPAAVSTSVLSALVSGRRCRAAERMLVAAARVYSSGHHAVDLDRLRAVGLSGHYCESPARRARPVP